MYFFDLYDYYTYNSDETTWYNTGRNYVGVGCAGFIKPNDFADYGTTADATRDAFLKALSEWFLASSASGNAYIDGFTPINYRPDSGCTPTYNEIWVNCMYDYCDWQVSKYELMGTINLNRYYYNAFTNPPLNYPDFVGKTYEEFLDYMITYEDSYTGVSTVNISIYNPYTSSASAITKTVNFGTSFEISDLKVKVNNYDNLMKKFMCSVKNMMAVIDGDTFDELPYDNNLNFSPNNGENYTIW
jgi:hypothetical protein